MIVQTNGRESKCGQDKLVEDCSSRVGCEYIFRVLFEIGVPTYLLHW